MLFMIIPVSNIGCTHVWHMCIYLEEQSPVDTVLSCIDSVSDKTTADHHDCELQPIILHNLNVWSPCSVGLKAPVLLQTNSILDYLKCVLLVVTSQVGKFKCDEISYVISSPFNHDTYNRRYCCHYYENCHNGDFQPHHDHYAIS